MNGLADDDMINDRAGQPLSCKTIRARAEILEPGILLLRELPNSNAAVLAVLIDHAKELVAKEEDCVVIIDLTEATSRPDPAMMRVISDSASDFGIHVACVQPSSIVVKAVLKFVFGRVAGIMNNSIHDTREEALAEARAVRRRRGRS
ncbi:MAG: hypothetical protein KC731_12260 [Myxococcales bacterium]|nr:hypothetical protein [Myxococcales bacterium]